MSEWPNRVWVLLVMQVLLALGIYRLEKGIEHACRWLLRMERLYADSE